jgi:hypothetical protein
MHKKPFIAVLILGLLFLMGSTAAMAFNEAYDGTAPRVQTGGGHDKSNLTPSAAEVWGDPLVSMQGGQTRTVPGTFCDGQWQQSTTFGINLVRGGWWGGGEFYTAYQDFDDPVWHGTCAPPSNYTFDVTAVNTVLNNTGTAAGYWPANNPLVLQPIVWDADVEPLCGSSPSGTGHFPGGVLCVGPEYSFVLPSPGGSFQFNLAFPIECCVGGPYYAGYYAPNFIAYGALRMFVDDGSHDTAPDAAGGGPDCGVFNEYGFGWDDLQDDFETNLNGLGGIYPPTGYSAVSVAYLLWSEGYTPDDVATHCTAGECDYNFWYLSSGCSIPLTRGESIRFADGNDDWATYFPVPSPSGGGRTREGVRFSAIGLDTLKEVRVVLYPDLGANYVFTLKVWDALGGPSGACGLPTPGSVIWSTDVTANFYPMETVVPIPDLTFGTLNGGAPPEEFFVTIERNDALSDPVSAGLPGYKGDECGGLPFWPQPGCFPPDIPRSILFFPAYTGNGSGLPTWRYTGEFLQEIGSATPHCELLMEALICREVVPIVEDECDVPGFDEWTEYGHDAQRTSASDINLGDPCQVNLEWSKTVPQDASFCNPTVANDIVYQSASSSLMARDLATGAIIDSITSSVVNLIMGGSNRGNTTIGSDGVYVTGGTFRSISKYPFNLSTPIWSNTSLGHSGPACAPPLPATPPLGAQNRFNASLVVNVGGTDVLFVLTEPIAAPGQLGQVHAFEAATGCLFTGWATNPITLDRAARHGPTWNGTELLIGTANSNLGDGTIWSIDPSDGSTNWQFLPGDPLHGFPGGVSAEGSMVYAGANAGGTAGHRYALDVSGGAPAIVWDAAQEASLYGAPTIGRNFLYFPQDGASGGIQMVDKAVGLSVFNFGFEGVDHISGNVTITCDNYLFAGTRSARWFVANANSLEVEWWRQYPVLVGQVVNGTALAEHSSGDQYAVVSSRLGGGTGSQGIVSAYKLNAGTRPRLTQFVDAVQVVVPLGSGLLSHTEPDVFRNDGCEDLDFTAVIAVDAAPNALASSTSPTVRRYMHELPSVAQVADRYARYADGELSKRDIVDGIGAADNKVLDGEWSERYYNRYILPLEQENLSGNSVRNQIVRAASSSVGRTIAASATINGVFPATLAPDELGEVAWDFNGAGLERNTEVEYLIFDHTDPDFDVVAFQNGDPQQAVIEITYVGGCPNDTATLVFNDTPGGANERSETNWNWGTLGASNTALHWPDDPHNSDDNIYDGTLVLVGDSGTGEAIPHSANVRFELFGKAPHDYVPNPTPGTGQCGFERMDNIVLGYKRTGGCPGTPEEIRGQWIQSSYSDTNFSVDGASLAAAIGLDVLQTEVGAFDPLYGDFKLIRWEIINRNNAPNGPIYAGSYFDWDVGGGAGYATNTGVPSDNFNGYAIWDNAAASPRNAYGVLSVNQPSLYSGVDPSADSPYRIQVYNNSDRQTTRGWNVGFVEDDALIWNDVVNEQPTRSTDGGIGTVIDRAGILFHQPFTLDPLASTAIHQALYSVDGHNGAPDVALIDADATALAARAARWAGFARGDVNDDGFVDLGDALWIDAGNPIYPDAYSGDVNNDTAVDAADVAQLVDYVSGNLGAQPVGAWRFPQ